MPILRVAVYAHEWAAKAACRDVDDPEIFFPEHGNTRLDVYTRMAKSYCWSCDVRLECLKNAQPYGIWGGTTPAERRALVEHRRRSKAKKP